MIATPFRRVLGIDPATRSIGFAVLEGPHHLIDWGTRTTGNANSGRALEAVASLIARFQPQIVALEDPISRGSRRCQRMRTLLDQIASEAPASVRVLRVPMHRLRSLPALAGKKNKFERAHALARLFPELELRLPRYRKPWMSEDERVNLFDALALALASFSEEATKVEQNCNPGVNGSTWQAHPGDTSRNAGDGHCRP